MHDLVFIEWDVLLFEHHEQLRIHGGQDGFIDQGVVRSAMARPQSVAQYNPDADLADLAAEYLFGLSTTQGFCDGNKRTAVAVTEMFLNRNGWESILTPKLLYIVAMAVSNATLDREGLAEILRDHMQEIPLEPQ